MIRFPVRLRLFFLMAVMLLAESVLAQQNAPAASKPENDQILQQHGFVVTATAYRQIFEPYLQTDLPVFVTSDSLLHAFHVLLNDTLGRYEEVNAERLADILELLWFRTESNPEPASDARGDRAQEAFLQLKRSAWRYARLVLAVGIRLLGKEPVGLEASLAPRVDDLVASIRRAATADGSNPGSLQPFAVDPADFRPPAFYRQPTSLQRYFLARRWLQTAPFRTSRDEELMAILLLGKALATIEDPLQRRDIEGFLRCYRQLMGAGLGQDLLLAAQIIRDRPGNLDAVRDYLDVIQYPQRQATFFILSPSRLPDSAFMRYGSIRTELEGLPMDGLQFCALLGSDFARSRIDPIEAAGMPVEAAIPAEGFARSYYQTLAALLDAPEPDAPVFAHADGWRAKNCNTALSAWVQMRATRPQRGTPHFAPLGEFYGDMSGIVSGLLEPQPDFFARLAETVEEVIRLFDQCESFTEPGRVLAHNLDRFADRLAAGRYPTGANQDGPADNVAEEPFIVNSARMALAVLEGLDVSSLDISDVGSSLETRIRRLAESVRRGDYRDDPAYQALIIELNLDRRLRWQTLLRLCRGLEVMAHKQLRGVEFEERENYLLADYGLRLASIMGYSGTSFRHPLDNSPRIAEGPGKNNPDAVAIGRPRELLVRYPYRGRQILCRGAMLPFFWVGNGAQMNDAQWKARLDSDERPRRPAWIEPVLSPHIPQKPY